MLLNRGYRFPIRAALEYLDPALYDRLDAGDELVLYTHGTWVGVSDDLCCNGTIAHTLCNRLSVRKLACEISDVTPTRIVWQIVDARDRTQADHLSNVSTAAE